MSITDAKIFRIVRSLKLNYTHTEREGGREGKREGGKERGKKKGREQGGAYLLGSTSLFRFPTLYAEG